MDNFFYDFDCYRFSLAIDNNRRITSTDFRYQFLRLEEHVVWQIEEAPSQVHFPSVFKFYWDTDHKGMINTTDFFNQHTVPCEDSRDDCPSLAAAGKCWKQAIGRQFRQTFTLWNQCKKSCRRCNGKQRNVERVNFFERTSTADFAFVPLVLWVSFKKCSWLLG